MVDQIYSCGNCGGPIKIINLTDKDLASILLAKSNFEEFKGMPLIDFIGYNRTEKSINCAYCDSPNQLLK